MFSKMSGNAKASSRTAAFAAVAGAASLAVQTAGVGFVAPDGLIVPARAAIPEMLAPSKRLAEPASSSSSTSSVTVVAGAATLATAASLRRARASGKHIVASRRDAKLACQQESQQSMDKLMDLAVEVSSVPKSDSTTASRDLVERLSKLAASEVHRGGVAAVAASEALRTVGEAMQSSAQVQLRAIAASVAAMIFAQVITLQPANAQDEVQYSEFLDQVNRGDVEMVRVAKNQVSAQYTTKDGSRRQVNLVPNSIIVDSLFNQLAEKKIDVSMQNQSDEGANPLDLLARFAGPAAWITAALLALFGGGSGPAGAGMPPNPFELGKSKAKVVKDGDTKTKFADVAGCDGAKGELMEVVDFLKNNSRYAELGATIPKGALLVGPPGTGKTLLAKAVAGEAGVPFFSCSASEFVEIYAGIGASRVRDLFAEAKKAAPCIIFIDEIDAVGRQRSQGFGQGNDEREQTVNQLLTEMDGFEANNGVVVLAATNRADILDKALVRPGRFDRSIQVDPPDVEGRAAIMKVHAKGKSLAQGVDFQAVARQTPGMSGADLANLLNEAAIVAARQDKTEIEMEDIGNALERIMIGLESKDAVMSEKKRKLVAYHEAGHAILGALVKDYDAVAKISIVPRGPAGGVTIFMPTEERLNSGLYSKEFLENRICVALGGRLAEEIVNGKDNVTTGASNDFQQCTQAAKAMVTQLGMSEVVGQRAITEQQSGNPMMGQGGGGAPPVSQTLKKTIDAEVKRIVDKQFVRGKAMLTANRFLLDKVAEQLLEKEKISGQELVQLINGVATVGELVEEREAMAMAAFVGEEVASLDQ